jgi:hypothetical protein
MAGSPRARRQSRGAVNARSSRAGCREALGTVAAAFAGAHRFSGAAAASGAVTCPRPRQRRRRMRASLVGGVRQTPLRRHGGEMGRGQQRPLRPAPAARAFVRLLAFGHRPHFGERSAASAEIVVNRHRFLPTDKAAGEMRRRRPTAPAPSSGKDITCPARSAYRLRPIVNAFDLKRYAAALEAIRSSHA